MAGPGGDLQADHRAAAGGADARAGRRDDPLEAAPAAGRQRQTHAQARAGHASAVVSLFFFFVFFGFFLFEKG